MIMDPSPEDIVTTTKRIEIPRMATVIKQLGSKAVA